MNPESHQEIYRLALETACSELGEITAEFEKLRTRKGQVERLIAVLKPVIGGEENSPPAAAVTQEEQITLPVETPAQAVPQEDPQPVKQGSGMPLGIGADPFQRRIDHVLGIGAGIRDVRQYTRQF
ncbi:MAG TPA: hypothetical protein VN753_11920 [Terracidiphilus sp.]|nr:hypothetical protein [Terracidiphilus sp.]